MDNRQNHIVCQQRGCSRPATPRAGEQSRSRCPRWDELLRGLTMCIRVQPNWVVPALLLAAACSSGEEQTRTEARSFLSLHAAMKYESPANTRAADVARLEKLLITRPEVQSARDLCVSGHRELLTQEALQERQAVEIEGALAKAKDGAPLPPEVLARLQGQLASSDIGLGRARSKLEQCEAAARSLSLRYGRR